MTDTSHIVGGGPKKVLYTLATINRIGVGKAAKALTANEAAIVAELTEVQGLPVDFGGYYAPDKDKTSTAMRPSKTFNTALSPAIPPSAPELLSYEQPRVKG